MKDNYFVVTTLVITSIVQIIIVMVPNIAKVFELGTISPASILGLLVLTVPLLVAMEIFKAFIRSRDGKKQYRKS